MADLLNQVRREIDERLTELRPVLDEVRRLERAREALGSSNGPPRRPRARRSRPKGRRARMTKAMSQEVHRRVLALLSSDPRQGPSALALLTDTSPARMSARLGRLVKEGKLSRSNRGGAVRYEVTRPAPESNG